MLAVTKVGNLIGRALGFSSYGVNMLSRTWKGFRNFVSGDTEALVQHAEQEGIKGFCNQIAILPRVTYVVGAVVTGIMSLTGLSYHAWGQFKRDLNSITDGLFGTTLFNITDDEKWQQQGILQKALRYLNIFTLPALLVGGVVTGLGYVAKVTLGFLGFSAYSWHQLSTSFKTFSNFVFGTDFTVDDHQTKLDSLEQQTPWYNKVALLTRVAQFVMKGAGLILGFIGLTKTNIYERGIVTAKVFANDNREDHRLYSLKPHQNIIKSAELDPASRFLTRYNLIRGVSYLVGAGLYAAGVVATFAVRRLVNIGQLIGWCLTIGGNCCQINSDNEEIQDMRQYFKDLSHTLNPFTGFDDITFDDATQLGSKQMYPEDWAVQIDQAVDSVKRRNWWQRRQYFMKRDIRICFGLGIRSITSKVINAFAAKFEEYIEEQKHEATVRGFFVAHFESVKLGLVDTYKHQSERAIVARVADAVKFKVWSKMADTHGSVDSRPPAFNLAYEEAESKRKTEAVDESSRIPAQELGEHGDEDSALLSDSKKQSKPMADYEPQVSHSLFKAPTMRT